MTADGVWRPPRTYVYLAYSGALQKDAAYRSAKEALARALQLDDSIGEAYDTLGLLSSQFDWDWEVAEQEFDRAIALAPSYSCAHEDRATFLAATGRRSEALAEISKIEQLDYGVSSAASESATYYELQDYPALIEASRRGLLLDPPFSKPSSPHRSEKLDSTRSEQVDLAIPLRLLGGA